VNDNTKTLLIVGAVIAGLWWLEDRGSMSCAQNWSCSIYGCGPPNGCLAIQACMVRQQFRNTIYPRTIV
jgi:hypothetical protein